MGVPATGPSLSPGCGSVTEMGPGLILFSQACADAMGVRWEKSVHLNVWLCSFWK